MALQASFERAREHARAVSVIIYVINCVVLLAAVFYLSNSFGVSFSVLDKRVQQPQVTLILNSTDEHREQFSYTNSTRNSLVCIASAIPQLIGALMLFAATEKEKSPQKARLMIDCYQKLRLFNLFIGLAGFSILLVNAVAEGNPVYVGLLVLVFICSGVFRAVCILIVDTFGKALSYLIIADICAMTV